MILKRSELYRNLLEKAQWSHAHGRSVSHINAPDIELARLFTYAFRSQTIGAFHATREALERLSQASGGHPGLENLARMIGLLQQLEARAVDPVPLDFRALISSLYYYDRWIDQVIAWMEASCRSGAGPEIEKIQHLFVANLESITTGNGLYTASDIRLPEQATFVVPNLNIHIIPLIYGDHHSWNSAYLTAEGPGVAIHRHQWGAEIHLGFSPVEGRTILGTHAAPVREGYAMPIPPNTDHGFENLAGEEHFLPFIFGSLTLGGWGVFFDVEASAQAFSDLSESSLDAPELNHSIYLERAIQDAAARKATARQVLIPASRAGGPEIGGLELAVAQVGREGLPLGSDQFRIISVQRGRAKIQVGPVERNLAEHDHLGIPAGMSAHIAPAGNSPLVILDSTLRPLPEAG